MLILVALTSLIGLTQAFGTDDLDNFMQKMQNPQVQHLLQQAQNFQAPLVGQDDEDRYKTSAEESFAYMNAFFSGFQYQTILPSALNCSNYLEQSINVLNETSQQWEADKNGSSGYTTRPEDYIFNVTEWLSYSVAPGIRYCFNIGLEGYTFFLVKDEEFDGFADWFPAWLQNLLGNVVTFNALYDKIKEATDSNDKEESLFWYGKLANIIVDFEPLAINELEFESDTAPPWWKDNNDLSSQFPVDRRKSKMNSGHSQIHPMVQGWSEDAYAFSAGFLNITFGADSPNSSVCVSNLTKIVAVSISFGNHIKVISNESWLNASYDFQQIFESIHPIFFSCYKTGYEYYEIILNYVETFSDWKNLVYNLIHNIGKLYDATYFLIVHYKALDDQEENVAPLTPIERREWYFKLGIYYGTLVYRVLYTNPDKGDIDRFAEVIGIIPGYVDNLTDISIDNV